MNSPFTPSTENLKRLNSHEAVDFFRKLLRAEAWRVNLTLNKVHVSERVNVGDGGVDAAVEDYDGVISSGLIKMGLTCYQIKTGDSFKPWQEAEMKKELFGEPRKGEKSIPIERDRLGESVRNCLDKNGHYIIVCFGQDFVESNRLQAIEITKKFFAQCGYLNPQVEVWGCTNILGFVDIFLSLKMELGRVDIDRFKTHKEWSQTEDMSRQYVISPEFNAKAALVRDALRLRDRARHIRVLGEAGSGKTRFVLEVTKEEDLSPLVIYLRVDEVKPILSYLCREDNSSEVIIVVDECNEKTSYFIWDDLKNLGERVKLVTIYNQEERPDSRIEYVEPPKLSSEEIREIIVSYGVPVEFITRWVEFAGNSPRFAHMIGSNLRSNPDDILRESETFYERIVAGYEDPESECVKERWRVLLYISLFKRFGFKEPVDKEARGISNIIKRAFSSISWERFQEIVRELQKRKILQGVNTLYISPKALHIYLWAKWWQTYSNGFSLEDFLLDLPKTELREWFYEMFVYAAQSQGASTVIKKLLAEGGLFHDDEILRTELGANFFFAIAQGDPKAALKYLQRKIGSLGKDELLQFTTGRRQVIGALERIAVWKDLFDGASQLLLQLAAAENEGWANNATGVFCDLFSFGYGAVATTEAFPEQRLLVLKEALNSEISEHRIIAIKACNIALESEQWNRYVGAEYQGLRQEPKLWSPKTYGEVWAVYQEVWQMLGQSISSLSNLEQQEVLKVMLGRARGLARIDELSPLIVESLRELSHQPITINRQFVQTVRDIVRYSSKEMSSENKKLWVELDHELHQSSDFHSSLQYYLSLSEWDYEDYESDQINDCEFLNGEPSTTNNSKIRQSTINRAEIIYTKLGELVNACMSNPLLLDAELDWLVSSTALNIFRFGFEIGKQDQEFSLLDKLLNAQRNSSNLDCLLLSGYFQSIFQKDIELWEKYLDDLVKDQKLAIAVPEITRRSGNSERSALRILHLAQKGVIAPIQFSGMIFAVRAMSESIFLQWMEFLLNICHHYTASIIINLFYSRCIYTSVVPNEDITFRVLCHYLQSQKQSVGTNYASDSYQWGKIARHYFAIYPNHISKLLNEMFRNFDDFDTIIHNTEVNHLLLDLVTNKPQEVWNLATQYIEPRFTTRAFHITRWLRSAIPPSTISPKAKSIIEAFEPDYIWNWIDANSEERASYAASFIPNQFFREDGQVCFAREILVRYGNREDVRSALVSNFSTDSWIGEASLFYQKKQDTLLKFKEGENNINVRSWIDYYIEILDNNIRSAVVFEERRAV